MTVHMRPMTRADIPLGMRLKAQAGWNQLDADWLRCLDLQPDGCFVLEDDGVPRGTVTTCIFGDVAWIAMVLVDVAVRGRGLGKALMQHALAFLDAQGVRSIRLDATALGQPLYRKLGFADEYLLARYEGVSPGGPPIEGVRPARPADVDAILRLDHEVTQTDRRKLLHRLFAEQPDAARVVENAGRIDGYLTVREGSRALQIGPCIGTPAAGALLLADALMRCAGRYVYVDMPVDNAAALVEVERDGLKQQRQFVRMGRGPRIVEDVGRLWCSAGPEKG